MTQQASGQWYFGFKCANCSDLMTVQEDESKGQKGFQYVSHGNDSDKFLKYCVTCGHEDWYPIEQMKSYQIQE
ncbi:MAG TPA: hypothetical protein VF297_03920 [Pyrinomonadaceae bacterium]